MNSILVESHVVYSALRLFESKLKFYVSKVKYLISNILNICRISLEDSFESTIKPTRFKKVHEIMAFMGHEEMVKAQKCDTSADTGTQ